MKGGKTLIRIIIAAVVAAIFALFSLSKLITDFQWFKALEYDQIFLVGLNTKIFLFFVAAIAFLVFAFINLLLSKSKIPMKVKAGVVVLVSFFVGLSFVPNWFVYLQYIKQVPFGIVDPIFSKDAAFYVFTLPFLQAVWGLVLGIVILTLILVSLDYLQDYIKERMMQRKAVPDEMGKIKRVMPEVGKGAMIHLGILGSFVFILMAVSHYLARFSIMYSEQGIVVGAGYTDVAAYLPIVNTLMVLALLVAVLIYVWFFFTKRLKKRHILLGGIVFYLVAFIFAPTIIPAIVQQLRVDPNELNLEAPYMEHNIKFTRLAYGLDKVEQRDYAAEEDLTADILADERSTLDNVRLLDWRPLTQTYRQTQEIRLYYDLSGIDLDRYDIEGKYTEVMLAPREMNQDQLAENAKTWVNQHLVYTHGYGVVMSPVNKVTKEGLPTFYMENIPPEYNVEGVSVDKPQIYYGERGNEFVIVNTKQREFDYPKGDTNEYINYDANGGVQLDSFWTKVLMAARFADLKILLSSDITTSSRIMFYRNIRERISKITPFLKLDSDPYIVIDSGKLYWIQDAYTVTGNFPYSEKREGINYVRNSVKVVVDAYTGKVNYYVVDASDPLIQTYARIFPNEFKSLNLMPPGLKEHLRYPEDLFKLQSDIYSDYHMEDVTVFYNKEDAWEKTQEVYGPGQKVRVEPYFIILELPGEDSAEFVLMQSFTPLRKDNMISWLAARSDGEEYGKLLLYRFPKDKLVYGPLQIEAKFDQDSEISQQLTLWSQRGSSVTRGNLLVIPIRNSLLYIEPLYLQAEQGQLPQLKRVLVSDGDRVVMEETLEKALLGLFGAETVVNGSAYALSDANEAYAEMLASMQNGDWAGFGDSFSKLGEILKELK